MNNWRPRSEAHPCRVPAVSVGVVAVSKYVLASKVPAVRMKLVAVVLIPSVTVPGVLLIVRPLNVVFAEPPMLWAPVPLKVTVPLL